jgi:hypothetical protein
MRETLYRNRKAVELSNDHLRVIALVEGGHIAAIEHKATGVNPLWTPPWPTFEPSTFDPVKEPMFGTGCDAALLAGIMGHNLCLDIFGGPSAEEETAGIPAHGEMSTACLGTDMSVVLPNSGLGFKRQMRLDGDVLHVTETVENMQAVDRPIAWTQHVTLGPPFIEHGATQVAVSATKSKVYENDFSGGKGTQLDGAEFEWPMCPRKDGGVTDLRIYPADTMSSGFTAQLVDPSREQGFFVAWNPNLKLAFGYVWTRTDFPWIGRWEENKLRDWSPWNNRTVTLGMEFGVSPMPESRRQMIDRGQMFGTPCYRWIPAKTKISVEYRAFARMSESMPRGAEWDGALLLF